MRIVARLLALLIGLIFGLFQTAFIIGKSKGIDIREHGSGNSGTTNALRVLGTKIGLIVFFGDALKAVAACLIAQLLFGHMFGEDLRNLFGLYAGLGCVLSHDFPFYMNFKGGKGIACTAGLIVTQPPWFIFLAGGLLYFFGPFLLTHYVSLGSMILYPAFMIQMIIMGQMGMLSTTSQAILNEMYIILFFMCALAEWQHRANFGRLIHGTERKTYLSSKAKARAAEKENS